MAVGVPGRLRPRIFSTFGTTRVVGRQPPLTQVKSLVLIFRVDLRVHGFVGRNHGKNPPPPGIDPGTSRLVALTTTLHQAPTYQGIACKLSDDDMKVSKHVAV